MAHHLDEEALELCIRDSALSCGLKDQQKQFVLSFCKGKDIFACLSTGFGKSACFVILPKLFDLLKKESPGHSIILSYCYYYSVFLFSYFDFIITIISFKNNIII